MFFARSVLPATTLLVLLTISTCPAPVLAQQIELQIRTASPDDDYLTWAPTPARIRQVPQAGASYNAADKTVVLTNDPEQPAPPNRKQPLDGNVAFAKSVAAGATASEPTLELVLPKDGTWVSFIVAGSYPRHSSADKDAVIEVHDGSASGAVLHKHAAMVRIRKDHRELTDQERKNFLTAVSRLLRENRGYERFVRIHQVAGMGKREVPPNYYWPDAGHRGSGFLPWHRAYLLSFERALQALDASVALPYWKMDQLPSVFEENFMGANVVATGGFVEPTFAADNPLAHWAINGEALFRFPRERRTQQAIDAQGFFSDERLFMEQTYQTFSRTQEGNPHGPGHNWTGPWMQNCMISPSDPVFWPFHTGIDRQWAKWQRLGGGRLQPDGSQSSFNPNDTFDDAAPGCNATSSSCMPIGHHLKDTMWPWDSKVGPGVSLKGNRPPADLAQGLIGPFAAATIGGLWPAQPAMPTPADMIDYAATTPQRLDLGFAYDDVPYGADPQQVMSMTAPTAANARMAENQSTEIEVRTALAIASDQTRPDAQRIEALQVLRPHSDPAIVPATAAILDEANRSAALGSAAIEALSLQMMFGDFDHTSHHAAMDALHKALADKDVAVRQSALQMLASHRDPALIDKLANALNNPADKSFSAVDAIRGLVVAGGVEAHAASIRRLITAGDNEVRAAAIVALAPDAASKPAVAAILADRNQPESVRSAAIRSLAAGKSEVTGPLVDVLKNPQEAQGLREQAATALAANIETHGRLLDKARLNDIAGELRKVGPSLAPAVGRALSATEALEKK